MAAQTSVIQKQVLDRHVVNYLKIHQGWIRLGALARALGVHQDSLLATHINRRLRPQGIVECRLRGQHLLEYRLAPDNSTPA